MSESPLWTSGGELPAAGLTWLLETFATPFVEHVKGIAKEKWQEHQERQRWQAALESYGQSLLRHYGRVRVLGKNEDVPLADIYTDVTLLDQLSARRRWDIQRLMREPIDRFDLPRHQGKRVNGLALVNQGKNLYILGKPGAGKTTFLKNVAVRAIQGKMGLPAERRLPLFVTLHEWAASPHPELFDFLVSQLDIHKFPESGEFLRFTLEQGRALLLLDGLDEVRQEGEQRVQLVRRLRAFIQKYDRNQFLITCRVAASEYVFPGLQDVEVADFTPKQVDAYARNWFGAGSAKYKAFMEELALERNRGLRELCNVPLLLSLLCLYFDDTQEFPLRRAELYEDALDALLRKWDSSQAIRRDQIYRDLSHRRKQQMLARIATPAFEQGQLYFTTRELAEAIQDYLSHLPGTPEAADIDGEAVLRAVEAHHGVLVERAHNIHSFSHLSFQEYFTARYIADNEARGTVRRLVQKHLTDPRWREVFLLTASLLDEGDEFLAEMQGALDRLAAEAPRLAQALAWADVKAGAMGRPDGERAAPRLAYLVLALALDRARARARALDRARALALDRDLARDRDLALDLARARALALDRDLALALDRDLALDLARARALALALDLALALARRYGSAVGIDYALYYAWAMTDISALFDFLVSERQGLTNAFPRLIDLLEEWGVPALAQRVARLGPPPADDDPAWQAFADNLWQLLEQERGFLPPQKPTAEELEQVADYLYGSELLVQCLDLAYVKDREAVLARLLRPPKEGQGGSPFGSSR